MDELKQQFQTLVEDVRTRYDRLEDRERWAVNAALVLVGLALIYLLIIAPAQRAASNAEMKLQGQLNLQQWMQDNEPLARAAAGNGGATRGQSDQPLQSVVPSTAPRYGLTVKRIEPESNGRLRVTLEKVSFDKTVQWLNDLNQRYGAQVASISIDSERESGVVTVKMVLQK